VTHGLENVVEIKKKAEVVKSAHFLLRKTTLLDNFVRNRKYKLNLSYFQYE